MVLEPGISQVEVSSEDWLLTSTHCLLTVLLPGLFSAGTFGRETCFVVHKSCDPIAKGIWQGGANSCHLSLWTTVTPILNTLILEFLSFQHICLICTATVTYNPITKGTLPPASLDLIKIHCFWPLVPRSQIWGHFHLFLLLSQQFFHDWLLLP